MKKIIYLIRNGQPNINYMKKITKLSLLLTILLSANCFSQVTDTTKTVINTEMVKRFNSARFDSTTSFKYYCNKYWFVKPESEVVTPNKSKKPK